MFIANDSNYTFGQFLDLETMDIKVPVYSKCFTDTESLKGYRFIHDTNETDPEKCVCFSVYSDTTSEATSTAFREFAVVSDLTSVMFRVDAYIGDTALRDVPYYHVIIPVENIADETEIKYLVIKMTKEVEIFPENYPYYELVDTFADAEPTSAEAPSSGITPTGTITITENDTYDVTNYASAEVNVSGGSSDFSAAEVTITQITRQRILFSVAIDEEGTNGILAPIEIDATGTYKIPLYKGKAAGVLMDTIELHGTITTDGGVSFEDDTFIVTGDGSIDIPQPQPGGTDS